MLGIDPRFFTVVGKKNPMERKWFHELTPYQRVWIVKAVCDNNLVSYCRFNGHVSLEVQDSLPLFFLLFQLNPVSMFSVGCLPFRLETIVNIFPGDRDS
jgi:hypothetical protein